VRGISLGVRAIVGVWFAAFALAASAGLYLAAVADRDALTIVLYLGYPSVSAFVAAVLFGHRVLAASTPLRSAGAGVGIVVVAFVFFAALYVATFDAIGRVQNRPAFLGVVMTFGLAMTAPIVLPTGAAAGYFLHLTRQQLLRRRSSPTS
jgi:hypothetical protein